MIGIRWVRLIKLVNFSTTYPATIVVVIQSHITKTLTTPGSSFNSIITGAWEGYFPEGAYRMVYKSGAFKTNTNTFIIGTGALNLEKLI